MVYGIIVGNYIWEDVIMATDETSSIERRNKGVALGIIVAVIVSLIIVTGITLGNRFEANHVENSPKESMNSPTDRVPGKGLPASAFYVADNSGYILRVEIDGTMSIVAGNGNNKDRPVPGPATESPLRPGWLAVDSAGNVYATSNMHSVVKIATDGTLSIVAGGECDRSAPKLGCEMLPAGLAVDKQDNLFIADALGFIWKLTPEGQFSIVAGKRNYGTPTPGRATDSYMAPLYLVIDSAENVYFSDAESVWKMSANGDLSILAGVAGEMSAPGIAGRNSLSTKGIAVEANGSLVIAETSTLYRLKPDGDFTRILNTGTEYAQVRVADLFVNGVAVDKEGNILIADGHGFVEQLSLQGEVTIVAGNGNLNDHPVIGVANDSPMAPVGIAIANTNA